MVSFNYNDDGTITLSSLYSDALFKELYNQCANGKYYVPNSFKHNPLVNALSRVSLSNQSFSDSIDNEDTYSLVALQGGRFKLVCHSGETFLKVFTGLVRGNNYEYVEGSVILAPANYTCELVDHGAVAQTEQVSAVSFDVNSEPDTSPSNDFNLEVALGFTRKHEFLEYVNSFGFKLNEKLSLSKLKNQIMTKS